MINGFTGAWLIDVVIAITLLEAAALSLHHRLTGKGVAPGDFIVNLVSGLCLMLALRGALGDAGSTWVLAPLALAGLTAPVHRRGRETLSKPGASSGAATTWSGVNRPDAPGSTLHSRQ